MSELIIIFLSVFLAELGDKTQLATLLFASKGEHHPVTVFLAASAALVLSSGLAVAAGTAAERLISGLPFKLIAGIGFIAIGLWSLFDHFARG